MKIAYSPCPNDTFVFHAWAHGLIPGAPELDVLYADIDVTNKLAAEGSGPDVLKISYAALPWVLKDYALLPCGGALGRGCGPLVLTKNSGVEGAEGTEGAARTTGTEGSEETARAEGTEGAVPDPAMLSGRRVAVPSERSTAYLLFRLWAAQNVPGGVGEIVVMPFHEIMPAVRDGLIDAGLVIHEARFTYPSYGLALLTDLGSWWESDTNLPIPLGAIIARRSMDLEALAGWARASVEYAWAHPEASRDYVMQHAQEMDPQVAEAHIDLYVNEFTADLGESGYGAVLTLLQRAAEEGLVPQMDYAALLK
ncbi:1,4-dihydroxy-6-naphthoate synthase [Paenibacillus sp. LMG 31460]|uniref:1,4-dihydroxy-6-naphtoate synthase n=1 Tax=Paenibacillus germinis TaxID=2654979 RepID=A0ABX1Z666_9BACL|nr:1,4-dihydroxy-6-naphthoate synthase [Paenibacillus germinis]NOU87769.1 1,4-dihydroxy-6-naphthoate synthase [Paenibacillus germinis]